MALFKYTGQQFIPSCIENGIYASRLDNINDPFEGKGIRYPNQYRVVCLTASPYQMLMWAYYGNHRGCCIEFDVEGIPGIRQVEYIREFLVHEDMNTDEVIESLYKKGNEWSHEKEYRLVYHEPTADKRIWTRDGNNVFLKAPVKQIIFGFAAEMDEQYPEMLEYISEYNARHDQKIEVTKCKLKANKYQLEADRQFDVYAELESIRGKKTSPIHISDKEVTELLSSETAKPFESLEDIFHEIESIRTSPIKADEVPDERVSKSVDENTGFSLPADEVENTGLSWPADKNTGAAWSVDKITGAYWMLDETQQQEQPSDTGHRKFKPTIIQRD